MKQEIQRLRDEGYSYYRLGEIFGCSPGAIRRLLDQDEVRRKQREYQLRKSACEEYRTLRTLRRLTRRCYKEPIKESTCVSLIGCTQEQFRLHLEQQFKPGMSHENHGSWHIDHVRPLASFNLNDPLEVRAACHYTNFQPLWATDNLKKSDSV
jgi:predicted transcriptional regulator